MVERERASSAPPRQYRNLREREKEKNFTDSYLDMKHNERARVAPLDFAFAYSFHAQKKTRENQCTLIVCARTIS